MPLEIVIMRHPPVAVTGVCYGQSDVPLAIDPETEIPRLAADPLVRRATRAWTSPWHRARVVAESLAPKLGLSLTADSRLSEIGFGEWELKTFAELERTDPERFNSWMRDWTTATPPGGGESIDDLVRRVRGWAVEVAAMPPAIHLVVAHGGVVRAFRHLATGASYREAFATPTPFLTPEYLSIPL